MTTGFDRKQDPALWLVLGLAAPYLGMLAYFIWQITHATGVSS
jgi:hypothetical protein